MDNLEWLQLASVLTAMVWAGAGAAVLPALLKAHPHRHPVLLLLLLLCVFEVAQAAFFVDTAFTSRGPRAGRGFVDVMALRVVSMTAAMTMFGAIWYTMRDRR